MNIEKRAEELANNFDCLTRLNSGGQPVLLKAEAAALILAAMRKAQQEEREACAERAVVKVIEVREWVKTTPYSESFKQGWDECCDTLEDDESGDLRAAILSEES